MKMKGKIGFVVWICALILCSVPVTAVFEVPEDAVTFEELGLSGTYDADATECETKEVTLRFAEPSDVEIWLYTYRGGYSYVDTYINGLLATENTIVAGNGETKIEIPGAFIKAGENIIHFGFEDYGKDDKFSEYPLIIQTHISCPQTHLR